jgi:hypothetical protein
MRLRSALDNKVACRKPRFRFDDFLFKMWLLYALLRFAFPLAVRRMRFIAPRCDFILLFAMSVPP